MGLVASGDRWLRLLEPDANWANATAPTIDGAVNCVRQAYNGGDPHGGTCTHTTTGLNALGEPNMSFG